MKPRRDGRVRCSAWLGGVVSKLIITRCQLPKRGLAPSERCECRLGELATQSVLAPLAKTQRGVARPNPVSDHLFAAKPIAIPSLVNQDAALTTQKVNATITARHGCNDEQVPFCWARNFMRVVSPPNDSSSATAATRRAACNCDGPPPFAAAHG